MYGSVLVVMVDSGSFALGGVHAIEGVGWGCGGGAHGALESKPSCNDACAIWPQVLFNKKNRLLLPTDHSIVMVVQHRSL